MSDVLLTCNAGSHSLKCALFEVENLHLIARFSADRIHQPKQAEYTLRGAAGQTLAKQTADETGYAPALTFLLAQMHAHFGVKLRAAGHRIVHGGLHFTKAVRVDAASREALEALVPLAPLHQPHNLALIDTLAQLYPALDQIACFDTAFHAHQPWPAKQYALPRALTHMQNNDEAPILRYGFHGLSYEAIANVLPQLAGARARQRVVALHLGGGASACAMLNLRSIASSMGFTALDGLMMGTRCGDLDAGVLLYLLQQKGWSAAQIEHMLYHESGLLGVSGISEDMRDLHASNLPEADEAISLFCSYAAREIGSLLMALGGLDLLVFTGAMGAGDAEIRRRICASLAWLGLTLDTHANAQHAQCISSEDSLIAAYVIPTDEESIIARHTLHALHAAGS